MSFISYSKYILCLSSQSSQLALYSEITTGELLQEINWMIYIACEYYKAREYNHYRITNISNGRLSNVTIYLRIVTV